MRAATDVVDVAPFVEVERLRWEAAIAADQDGGQLGSVERGRPWGIDGELGNGGTRRRQVGSAVREDGSELRLKHLDGERRTR